MGVELEHLMRHVRLISTRFPHRHTGEADEAGVAGYVAGELESYGLSVRVHEIPVMGWELVRPPRLEVSQPEARELPCVPFVFSGSTPAVGVQGELRLIGPTLVAGIAPPWTKWAIVVDGQARVLVVGRPSGGPITQTGPPAGSAGTQDGPHYTWPACVIGRDDLARLEEWRAAGVKIGARYVVETRYKPGCTTFVVEGTLPGRSRPDETVVVGAHHDTQGAVGFPAEYDSPGACDNASGVAAVLELARTYADVGYPRTLRFCTYGGEEWNLVGSRHYVRQLYETGELASIVAAINLDQTAQGDTLKIIASGARGDGGLDLAAVGGEQVRRLGVGDRYPVEYHTPPFPGSDHWPYHVAGVPVFYAAWDPVPGYHTHRDVVDALVAPDKFTTVTTLVQEVLGAIAEPHADVRPTGDARDRVANIDGERAGRPQDVLDGEKHADHDQ